ncbi:MAG: hypothetical protein H0T76_10175 [Nannocystis sp.]|nr:hypothetical protein [Nannocystis sp.]MBA3546838.1 hypothetical protein [Nannocystis sp.]
MNAPKKPGTDLSALKARLAKKAGGDAAAPAAPAAAEIPAPAAAKQPARPGAPKKSPAADPNFIPAPGEQAPPPATPDFIPAPGEQAPAYELPAPGEVAAPVAAAPARRQFQADDGTPFSGGGGGFDPNAGILPDTGGDIPQKSNKGLIALAAGAALVAGIMFGFVGNQITSKGAFVQQGRDKGAVMYEEAKKVSEMRKGMSLKVPELEKTIAANPDAGAKELVTMLTTNFDKSPKVDDLFGWQLAAVNSEGIKRTFDLYEEANGLKIDLGYLAGFVTNNVKALANGGPRMFAVQFRGRGVTLVERLDPRCGDPKAPADCPDGKEGEAIGFNIRTEAGGTPIFAPLGTEDGQIQVLTPDGPIYSYIVGLNPENNAKIVVQSLIDRIKTRLEAMAKAETRALKALQKYSDDPNVDGPAGELD